MYLSKLVLNPRPGCRAVLRDLASPYEMHRTLMRAFPDAGHGGPGRVLFRLEPQRPGHPPVVLVQSAKRPDWSALRQIPGYLACPPASKQVDPPLYAGQRLRFRLRANPTVKRDGKRRALVREEDQQGWLLRKAAAAGFRPVGFLAARRLRLTSQKAEADTGRQHRATHLAVDYEGVLEVTDALAFRHALAAGIGPAKGFGFGLLSIAPA